MLEAQVAVRDTVLTVRPGDSLLAIAYRLLPRSTEYTAEELVDRIKRQNGLQGDAIQIGLRSRDVLLATEQPRGISTRNVLSGRISALVRGNLGVEVTVDCDGTLVVSHVTQETVENLSLETGTSVWAVLKIHSH